MISLESFVKENKLMVVAHRGSSGTAPENSVAAFREAMESGSDMVEVDIQLTADSQIVAYHDYSPVGIKKNIYEMTYKEISEIDIGKGFDPKFKGEKIPLLRDVIQLIHNKNYLMIELKTIAGSKFRENAEKLLNLIYEFNYNDKCLFGSFNHAALAFLKKIDPSVITAAIKIPGDIRTPAQIKESINCDAFICSLEEMNQNVDKNAKDAGLFAGVYSVDTKDQLDTALQYHLMAIATNYPANVVNWLKDKGYLRN